jgi:hypothetical protein
VEITIIDESAPSGTELQLMSIVWMEIGPTRAPEHTKAAIIWCSTEKTVERSIILEELGWCAVNQMGGGKKCLVPKFEWHRSVSKKGKAYLDDMAMLALHYVVLLMTMRAIYKVGDSNGTKKMN